MSFFLITLVIAAAGAAVFLKLHVPVGAMIGAMVFVAAYNLICGRAFVFPQTTYVLQVCSGVLIGSTITWRTVTQLRRLWRPYLVMMAVLLSVTLLISLALGGFSSLDAITALLAISPGGMTDMTILSATLGANSAYVALLHTCRMLVILLCVPPFVKLSCKKEEKIHLDQQLTVFRPSRLLLALAAAAVCALIFVQLHIRAGAMLGAVLGGSLCTLLGREYHCPRFYTLALQVGAGAFTGAMVTSEIIFRIPSLFPAVLCVAATVWIYLLLNGWLMRKYFGMSKMTSMLACVPGGLSDMTLLAEELGGDLPTVATLQTLRLFSVIIIVPNLVPLVEWACTLLW